MSAATVAAIAKAAVAVLSNEKTRKALGWVIVAILSPLIVLVVLICAVLSGSSQHNVSAVELCFHGGTISSSATFLPGPLDQGQATLEDAPRPPVGAADRLEENVY